MRIRTHWRDNHKQINLEDNATALGYVCWQISLSKAKGLHQEDFVYSNDEQRTGVIREYLCFLVHVADRLVYTGLNEEQRSVFVETLADSTARHFQRNLEDVFGQGKDYRCDYINTLNDRIHEYSAYHFDDAEPGYQMLRGLGRHVLNLMGEGQTNRWVIDQTMELDAPDAVNELKKGLDNLFGTAKVLEDLNAPE